MTTVRLPENVAKLLSSTVVIESGVIKDFTRKWKKKTSQLKDLQKKLTKLYKEYHANIDDETMIDLAGKVFINRSVSIKETKETGKLFKELKSLYEKYGVLLTGKMMLELASESWDKENY